MTLAELLESLNVPFARAGESKHVTPGWLGIDCPFCRKAQGAFHLGIHEERLSVSCWLCGPHGLAETLSVATGIDCLKIKCQFRHLVLDWAAFRSVERKRGVLKLPPGVRPLLAPHKRFLKSRMFDPAEVERLWGVKGIGQQTRYGWRLFIPVRKDAETVSWTTRSLDEHRSYLHAPPEMEALPAKSLLYGAELARHGVAVTEGPLDAWRIGPGGVATLGVGVTRAQLLEIVKFPLRLIVLDSEPAAQRRARQLCDELSVFPGETVNVRLESAKDASRASKKEVNELRRMLL